MTIKGPESTFACLDAGGLGQKNMVTIEVAQRLNRDLKVICNLCARQTDKHFYQQP